MSLGLLVARFAHFSKKMWCHLGRSLTFWGLGRMTKIAPKSIKVKMSATLTPILIIIPR